MDCSLGILLFIPGAEDSGIRSETPDFVPTTFVDAAFGNSYSPHCDFKG